MNPAVYENRAQHRQVFDYNYNQMKDTLEYRQEKGLLFRHTSPDNPLQMAAGRRLNKSFDQSTNPNYRDVDFVKNIFDKGDTSLGDKNNFGSFKPSVVEGTGSKGMFLSRKQEGKQQGQVRRPQEVSKGPRDDAQFVKNAGLFF